MQGSWYSFESISASPNAVSFCCHYPLMALLLSSLRDTGHGLEERLGRLCRDVEQEEGHGQGKVSWARKISMVDEEEEEEDTHGDVTSIALDTKQTIRAPKIQMLDRDQDCGEG